MNLKAFELKFANKTDYEHLFTKILDLQRKLKIEVKWIIYNYMGIGNITSRWPDGLPVTNFEERIVEYIDPFYKTNKGLELNDIDLYELDKMVMQYFWFLAIGYNSQKEPVLSVEVIDASYLHVESIDKDICDNLLEIFPSIKSVTPDQKHIWEKN